MEHPATELGVTKGTHTPPSKRPCAGKCRCRIRAPSSYPSNSTRAEANSRSSPEPVMTSALMNGCLAGPSRPDSGGVPRVDRYRDVGGQNVEARVHHRVRGMTDNSTSSLRLAVFNDWLLIRTTVSARLERSGGSNSCDEAKNRQYANVDPKWASTMTTMTQIPIVGLPLRRGVGVSGGVVKCTPRTIAAGAHF